MAPPPPPLLPALLLLAMALPLKSWSADVPLGEFEGVTVDEAGLVVKLDLSGKQDIKLADIAGLESLKELNLEECERAKGECAELCPALAQRRPVYAKVMPPPAPGG